VIGGALAAVFLIAVADARRPVCQLPIDLLALGNPLAADQLVVREGSGNRALRPRQP
jgi:hypothetical protein